MEQFLVLSADFYEIPDEKTGATNTICKAYAINDYREDSDTSKGFKPLNFTINYDQFKELKKNALPAMYEIGVSTRPGAQGKPAVVVSTLKFIKAVEVFKKA